MGSRNQTFYENVAFVKAMPEVPTIVYIAVNVGRFTAPYTTKVVPLTPDPVQAAKHKQHHYTQSRILSLAEKKAHGPRLAGPPLPGLPGPIQVQPGQLDRLIRACRRRGLHPVLIDMPRNIAVIGHALDRPMQRYRNACWALADEYDIPFVNFVSAAGLVNRDFHDLVHLVEPGWPKFQSLLAAKTVTPAQALWDDPADLRGDGPAPSGAETLGRGDRHVTAAFALRPPRRDDLAGVVALFRACDAVEFGRPDTDDADVLAEWDSTGFDLEVDARLAIEPADDPAGERVIGYAHTFEKFIEINVHPERNGLGAGTVLREFVEARALAQAAAAAAAARGGGESMESAALEVKVWQAPRRTNGTAHRLLEAAGYTRGHHYVEMEADLGDDLTEPDWPAGVTVRTFAPGSDETACHALQNLAWGQYKTYEPMTFERWTDLTREPDFDPALWFLAEEDGVLLGMCLCREYEDQAWITSLGVHPDAPRAPPRRGAHAPCLRPPARPRRLPRRALRELAHHAVRLARVRARRHARCRRLGRLREGAARARAGLSGPADPSLNAQEPGSPLANAPSETGKEAPMSAHAFRCRECDYPFKTAGEGWERHTALMCPACGSADVSIFDPAARWEVVTMTAAERRTDLVVERGRSLPAA